jgi:ribosome maturation factor RimP
LITKEKIEGLAKAHLGNGPIYLTGVRVSSDNSINVYIDGDNGVTIADCVALSRAIEGVLDGGRDEFALDVSSHGATTPLAMPRQYKKNIGRELEVKLNDLSKIEGELFQADEEGFSLRYQVRENKPVGKGKITVEKTQDIKYTEVKEAKIKLKY